MFIIKRLVKLKEKAFEYGTNLINLLQSELSQYAASLLVGDTKQYQEKFIGLNAIDITKWLYSNSNFYKYLEYSFVGKHYEKKINLIKWFIILIALLIGTLIYFIFDYSMIFLIVCAILLLAVLIIFWKLKTGESYKSYYNRTLLQFLLNVYGINFSISNTSNLTDDELKKIINNTYDKKTTTNDMHFNSSLSNGNILDLELIRTNEYKDKDGNIRKSNTKIFDGFYLKMQIENSKNVLRGNTIQIRADENILSSLAEDTVKGIYESQREFSFNSEEMNRSFDCKVSGYQGFNDVDEMLMTVHKIITPSFEQHLLYLRERYNTFSMNIDDSGITATFNMERSLFQKAKHKELMDFKTTYREANEIFKMLRADLSGIEDFAYYNVFPFLERLYLIKYLTYLYLSYVDFENYYSYNNESINGFEESMKNIYTMNNKEFKEIYTEKIKKIKKNTKENAQVFEERMKKECKEL